MECFPIGKNTALVHCAASAASTAGVLRGQGPSSKVSTTSPARRKSMLLKCSKPKPGPPVVSISTTRATPSASGFPGQAAFATGGGPAGAAAGAGAAGAGAAACAKACGAAVGAAGATTAAGAARAGSGTVTGCLISELTGGGVAGPEAAATSVGAGAGP